MNQKEIMIYKTIVYNSYMNKVDVACYYDNKGGFLYLQVTSICLDNVNKYNIDNPTYLEHIKTNKDEIKKELKDLGLYEKGIIKVIKKVFNAGK
jgi:type III secretory pathway component EscU